MSVKIIRKNPDALKGVVDRINKKANRVVAVGYPKGKSKAYPDGTEVAYVAGCHVFGAGVPKRDFMALAKPDLEAVAKKFLKAAAEAEDEKEAEAILKAAGQEGAEAIKNAITELRDPPNAPGTLHPSVGGTNPKGKESDNTLIDTTHMRNQTTYHVRKK